MKWDGCTEVYGADMGSHYCDLRDLIKELSLLWVFGARYFCDDNQEPEYGICGLEKEQVSDAIANLQKRIDAA